MSPALFANLRFRPARLDPAPAARIKDWARDILALPDDAAVTVNEIVCADPACPGFETVLLVMRPGERTKAHKLTGAMADVTRDALALALALG